MPLQSISGQATLTTTEAAVLCLLAVGGERSGYDLARLASSSVGHLWTPARSQLYAVLPRLERSGLASGRTVAQQNRPDKRLYRITAEGQTVLDAWLESIEPEATDAFRLKVFYGGLMPRESLVAHLEAARKEATERLERFAELEAENSGKGNDRFHRLLIRYGQARAQTDLDWASEVLEEL